MEMEFNKQDSTGLVELTGDLNVVRVDSFRRQFREWLDANPKIRAVVIDFSGVSMIDSAGLGALVSLLKQIGERGGSLKLAGLKKRVRLVFEITRTHRIFDIHDSVDDALASLE